MYALIVIRYRRPMEDVDVATPAHREYLAELKSGGILLASGPFEPRNGGAILCRLPDDDPAAFERIRDGDPFWQQGVANYELLHWKPVLGREGLDAL
jgi:uncharacterized protein YciI